MSIFDMIESLLRLMIGIPLEYELKAEMDGQCFSNRAMIRTKYMNERNNHV